MKTEEKENDKDIVIDEWIKEKIFKDTKKEEKEWEEFIKFIGLKEK